MMVYELREFRKEQSVKNDVRKTAPIIMVICQTCGDINLVSPKVL